MTTRNARVVVIGGGIVGASIALGLAQQGAQVSVHEAGTMGSGTTSTSYGWVNANGKEPNSYYEINRAGIRAHEVFASESSSDCWFHSTGHLEVATTQSHDQHLRSRGNALAARDYLVEELTVKEAKRLEPSLVIPENVRSIVFFPDEGYIYPLLYLAETITQLRAAGGQIYERSTVCGFDSAPTGVIVRTEDGSDYHADYVVVAAGRSTDQIVQLAGGNVPLLDFAKPGDITVGYLARTNALPVKLSRLVTTAQINVRPEGGGRLLLQALDLDATADPKQVPQNDSDMAAEFSQRLQSILYGSTRIQIEQLEVGQRVMPADGKTIASPVPGMEWMYAVATHSGVTLAPYLGSAVAGEILGTVDPLLEDFRLTRFDEQKLVTPPRKPRCPGEQ